MSLNLKQTVDEIDCQHCGHVWEPVNEGEMNHCPLCRRSTKTLVSGKSVQGDVPLWRVAIAKDKVMKAAGEVVSSTKKVAKSKVL